MDNAFQLALTTDPLADSGEEDEDARCDYSESTTAFAFLTGMLNYVHLCQSSDYTSSTGCVAALQRQKSMKRT